VELLKPTFMEGTEAEKAEARACLGYVLDEIYKLLHPFMPFMTEELWDVTSNGRETLVCHAAWPVAGLNDTVAAEEINWLVDLVTGIRSVRAEMNVPAGAQAPLVFVGAGETTRERLAVHEAALKRLARVSDVSFAETAPKGSAQIVAGEATAAIPLGDLIDLKAEADRLHKAFTKALDEMARIDKKLSNPNFVAKADPAIVEAERDKRTEYEAEAAKLGAALKRVQDAG
jgi:valyl-tRNA synthetase